MAYLDICSRFDEEFGNLSPFLFTGVVQGGITVPKYIISSLLGKNI